MNPTAVVNHEFPCSQAAQLLVDLHRCMYDHGRVYCIRDIHPAIDPAKSGLEQRFLVDATIFQAASLVHEHLPIVRASQQQRMRRKKSFLLVVRCRNWCCICSLIRAMPNGCSSQPAVITHPVVIVGVSVVFGSSMPFVHVAAYSADPRGATILRLVRHYRCWVAYCFTCAAQLAGCIIPTDH